MKKILLGLLVITSSSYSLALPKACDELKSEINAKIEAKGVKHFTLEIIPADQANDKQVVGTCAAGKSKITYTKA
jgi:hypothetical protein